VEAKKEREKAIRRKSGRGEGPATSSINDFQGDGGKGKQVPCAENGEVHKALGLHARNLGI